MEKQEELNHLKELLDIHKRQLHHLELQKAKFGTLDVPGKIIIAIEDEEKEIQRLTNEIQGLEQNERLKPELQPMPEPQMSQNITVIDSQGVIINQAGRDIRTLPQEKKPVSELLAKLATEYKKELEERL